MSFGVFLDVSIFAHFIRLDCARRARKVSATVRGFCSVLGEIVVRSNEQSLIIIFEVFFSGDSSQATSLIVSAINIEQTL